MKKRAHGRDSTHDTLIRGLEEIIRQVHALARRCEQPGGAVVCTVHLRLTPRFMVQTAAERDELCQAVAQALMGLPGVTASLTEDEAQQRWRLLARES